MVQVSYPGVYIQEVPSGVRTITGVSTSIAMFIGRTERGQMNRPTRLFSFTDYERQFGTGRGPSEMRDQVRLFFQNGGTDCYVMRIAAPGSAASVTLLNEAASPADALVVTATEEGVRGAELRVEIGYDTPTPDETFNMRVFRRVEVSEGQFAEQDVELFTNLSMDPGSARYAVNLVAAQSQRVSVSDPGGIGSASGYSMSGRILDDTSDAALNALITNGDDFRVSVDGGDFVTVSMVNTDGVAGFATKINDALANDGQVATVSSAFESFGTDLGLLKITSVDSAGSVRIIPGLTSDITGKLQLGIEAGGIEVGPYALARPAPTGVFTQFEAISRLQTLAEKTRANFASITIEDAETASTAVTMGLTGGALSTGAAPDGLVNVRANLAEIAQAFNDEASAIVGFHWRARAYGTRLVFAPTSGAANRAATTFTSVGLNNASGDPVDNTETNTRYYSLGTGGTEVFQASGSPGMDGLQPTAAQLAADGGVFDTIRKDVDIFNILCFPKDDAHDDTIRRQFWQAGATFCLERRAFLIIDPPSSWTNLAGVTNGALNIGTLRQGIVKDHAAVYWPRLATGDIQQPFVDPCGTIAGIMARTDANRGVWKAPAGLEADLRGISGLEQRISDRENGVTNPQAVNTIRVFPNGIINWGARTMDGFDNSGNDDYKYVPVRRFALFLEESLFRGLQFAVFEPNDEPLWAQIRIAAGAFMNNLFRQGAFQGSKASDAYFVKVDSETTTQNDINLGIVNVLVGFAPLKPAEFVVVRIQQKAGQVQV